MGDGSLKTGVDGLIELLKKKNKLSIADAAKALGIGEATVKQWADFLVEENIIGLEYKFTKPFIYLNSNDGGSKSKIIKEERLNIDVFKQDFFKRAEASRITPEQIKMLWEKHVRNQLEIEKSFFFQEAKKRRLNKIPEIWEEYKKNVIKRACDYGA